VSEMRRPYGVIPDEILNSMSPSQNSQIEQLEEENGHLKAENNRLREALQALYDEQNGPPLENDKEDWQEAMRMAEEVLRGEN
jgi:regulator of replication initiation timing